MAAEVIQMYKKNENEYNIIDGELIKKAQKILKQREDTMSKELFDYTLNMKMSNSNGISMNSLAEFVLEKNRFKWDVLPEVDSMTIKEFIESLKQENIIEYAITYKEDENIIIWFILEEENYDNSIVCIDKIRKYKKCNEKEKFEYFLCDLDDIEEIEEDLTETNIMFEEI